MENVRRGPCKLQPWSQNKHDRSCNRAVWLFLVFQCCLWNIGTQIMIYSRVVKLIHLIPHTLRSVSHQWHFTSVLNSGLSFPLPGPVPVRFELWLIFLVLCFILGRGIGPWPHPNLPPVPYEKIYRALHWHTSQCHRNETHESPYQNNRSLCLESRG